MLSSSTSSVAKLTVAPTEKSDSVGDTEHVRLFTEFRFKVPRARQPDRVSIDVMIPTQIPALLALGSPPKLATPNH